MGDLPEKKKLKIREPLAEIQIVLHGKAKKSEKAQFTCSK